ncbi:ABC transporter ATP-binding protein [Nocardioides deserti]|uniref:ABC transporter ATP-binding protein n=1 Tax=Nocardioides deserti TaxID=1588644 RepID=A0ABR6U8V7_9ACTN|nr:ABC transporter ATP-binding protein [Nocardioides deserti]MBC2960877.1 ABC transporter ATP-binding protein [Nocardioides deserti]GGO77649.1 ABC transporter ATPase [Nocardioides deserti]
MITAADVSWSYAAGPVVAGVHVRTEPGRVLGLVGPNGSGKTTLLRLLHGALRTPTGRIEVDGDDLAALGPRETARRVAVVVQEPAGESTMSVAEMVLLGRSPRLGTFERTGARDRDVAAASLDRVGAAHLAARPYAALSGGERQRVLIARALAQEATHLLLDEPTNHLDVRYQHEVLALVQDLARTSGTCVVVVLHDLNLAARYCDDLLLLGGPASGGRVVAGGPAEDVLDPALLEPVYGIGVRPVRLEGRLHLLFEPLARPASHQPVSQPHLMEETA